MKRLLLVFWGICVLAAACNGSEISAGQARTAARMWVRNHRDAHMSSGIGGEPARVESFGSQSGRMLFHAVQLQEGGYVVTSGDDGILPVVAFSATGEFKDDPANPLAALLRQDMADRLALAAESGSVQRTSSTGSQVQAGTSSTTAKTAAQKAWSALLAEAETDGVQDRSVRTAAGLSSVSDVRVPVLMSTRWSQSKVSGSACYNYYTPNNYVCGCVATAGAQLMRYHTFPTKTVSVVGRMCWVDNGSRYRETKGGKYDWSLMPYVPESGVSKVQREAIGHLCHDVGVVARMNWTSSGSGAILAGLGAGLMEVFGYKNANWQISSGFETGDFKRVIYANLDAGCPVLLGISDSRGKNGHAIVADGYGYSGSTVYTHLNLGWAGGSDAWYALPAIGTDYRFSAVNSSVYNVFPDKTGELLTGRVTSSSGSPISGATVRATAGGTTSTGTTNARGIYALHVAGGRIWQVSASASGYAESSASVSVEACRDAEIVNLSSSGCSYRRGFVGNSWGNNFQLKKVEDAPEVSVSPGALAYTAEGGSGSVEIKSSAAWTASASVSWITLGYAAGTGNATLTVSVSRNQATSREGVVTVKAGNVSRSVRVSQNGVSKYNHLSIDNDVVISWDGEGPTDVVIPEGIVAIGEDAFYRSRVTSVKFPDSLTRISEGAFSICSSLTNVVWGTGLREIGGQAFAGDSGLKGCWVIPEGVSRLEYGALWGTGVEWIVLPRSLKAMSWGMFQSSYFLRRVYFKGNAPEVEGLWQMGINGDLERGSAQTFGYCSEDVEVLVPDGSTGWQALGSTALPGQWPVADIQTGEARSIRHWVQDEDSLELDKPSLALSSVAQRQIVAVRAIDAWSVTSSASWLTVTPASGRGFSDLSVRVTKNEENRVRTGCITITCGGVKKLVDVSQYGSGTEFVVKDGVLQSWQCQGRTDIVIPDGIKTVGEDAFRLSELTSVVIPGSVREIGKSAFRSCTTLTNVVLGSGLREIGFFAFAYCTSLSGHLNVPDSVTFIDTDAFWKTRISSVSLPGGLRRISSCAFEDCGQLEHVYFRGGAPKAMGYSDTSTAGNIFAGTPESLVVHVPYGSVGWSSATSSALPALWPVGDGEDARKIVNYDPTKYTIQFEAGTWGYWNSGSVKSLSCKTNQVYSLSRPTGLSNSQAHRLVGWQCSNGKRYDDGVLIFNLARPGETVTMTAIWE